MRLNCNLSAIESACSFSKCPLSASPVWGTVLDREEQSEKDPATKRKTVPLRKSLHLMRGNRICTNYQRTCGKDYNLLLVYPNDCKMSLPTIFPEWMTTSSLQCLRQMSRKQPHPLSHTPWLSHHTKFPRLSFQSAINSPCHLQSHYPVQVTILFLSYFNSLLESFPHHPT